MQIFFTVRLQKKTIYLVDFTGSDVLGVLSRNFRSNFLTFMPFISICSDTTNSIFSKSRCFKALHICSYQFFIKCDAGNTDIVSSLRVPGQPEFVRCGFTQCHQSVDRTDFPFSQQNENIQFFLDFLFEVFQVINLADL